MNMNKSAFKSFLLVAVVAVASLSAPLRGGPGEDGEPPLSPMDLSASTAGNRQCAVPAEIAGNPALREYVTSVCSSVVGLLDHNTGAGTGEMVRFIEQLSAALLRGSTIATSDLAQAGLTYESLRSYVLDRTDGQGQVIEVMAYEKVIERANKWLAKTGFGFFHVVQHPKARLLEAFRNATAKFPAKRGVTQDDVKTESDRAYPDNAKSQIKLPINAAELNHPNHKMTFSRYHLVGDPLVPGSLEDFPPASDPLKEDMVWYRRMQKARFGITLGVMSVATYAAGGFSPEATAVLLTGLGLEAQFIGLSKYWRSFWANWGFKGNMLVNFSYGGILASVQHLTESINGVPSTFQADEFLIRTGVLGATFIAAFGGMQVVSARMRDEGEYSEGGAMKLESIGNIVNNFGRFFATVAAMAGTAVVIGELGPVQFDTNTTVGWAIQGVYFALITTPLWFKRLVGDDVRAGLVAYDMVLHDDPSHPYNGPILGGVRRWCAEKIASLTRFYTPTRVRVKRTDRS